jgi:molybdopterin-guanine dinucleotide biosynthesis protein A
MGKDKAFLLWDGKPLIQHVIDAAAAITDKVCIVADSEEYDQFGLQRLQDRYTDHGPVGGIYTALENALTDRVLILGCDMPMLTPAYLEYLVQNAVDCEAAVSFYDARLHPLAAVYHKDCLPKLADQLLNKRLRMMEALELLQCKQVEVNSSHSFYNPDLFFNVNTPEKYALLLQKTS